MSNTTLRGCRAKSHRLNKWEIYESLPREVRDKLKIDRDNLCVGCIRNQLKREGLESVLLTLKINRTRRRERQGREIVYVYEPELKP